MSNQSRGKAGERAAAKMLNEVFGEHWNWRRKLSEGREADEGDLLNDMDNDLVFQVKVTNAKNLTGAIRSAAKGGADQCATINGVFGVGLTKVPGARSEPRWVVSMYDWPLPVDSYCEVATTSSSREAIQMLSDGHSLVLVTRSGAEDLVLSSVDTFHAAYLSLVPGTLGV